MDPLSLNSSSSLMKIVEECVISLQHGSPCVVPTTLPLTLFDYPWLLFPQIQPLFFFELPPHIQCLNDVLPGLKHSLSCALHYYFPFAGNLVGNPNELTFVIDQNSSLSFTVAHSDADFEHLCSYLPKDAELFHHLVPSLPPVLSTPDNPAPLLALQVTYFSSSRGISIGIAYHPALCDQRSFCRFLHSWASFSKYGHLNRYLLPPAFDRSVILDQNGLRTIFSGQLLDLRSKAVISQTSGLVRATFVMSTTDIQNAKGWIIGQCDKQNRPYPVLLSPYIVACAFVWASLLRSSVNKGKGPMYFGFIAGGITRLNYPVPINYFGNCVGFGRAVAKRKELLGEDGILTAADAIATAVKAVDTEILRGAENWISEWELLKGSEEHMNVVGSPKVNLYETDFGWGRPKKIEEISIDVIRGISLTESRDMKGGMEIGLALSNSHMEAFCTLFNQGLDCFSSGGTF